jgi:hypothetical protein
LDWQADFPPEFYRKDYVRISAFEEVNLPGQTPPPREKFSRFFALQQQDYFVFGLF